MTPARIISQIAEPPFDPGYFFAGGLDQEAMRGAVLVRGPLGTYNGIPSLAAMLEQAHDYSALVIRKGQGTQASLRFNTPEAATAFLKGENIGREIKSRSVVRDSTVSVISPNLIIITF